MEEVYRIEQCARYMREIPKRLSAVMLNLTAVSIKTWWMGEREYICAQDYAQKVHEHTT